MSRCVTLLPAVSRRLATVLVAAVTMATVAVPAHAAPAAPIGLTQGTQAIPTLSWTHSSDATQYSVQLSRTQDLTGLIGATVNTDNRHYVPTDPLPWADGGAPLYWRVSVRTPAQGDWSQWTELTRQGTYSAPEVTSPASEEGTVFDQPQSPAFLTWHPVPGAREYDVQISQDRLFIDDALITKDKTVATRYVVEAPQVATTYWFRVRAVLTTANGGVVTDFSTPRSYRVSALPGTSRTNPPNDSSMVTEAVLDWEPIKGAKSYDLQIATDPAFGSIVHAPSSIVGTSYARPRTLDNDQYYWRVRAVDVAGNAQEWASRPTWQFERHWPELPQPIHPALPADIDPATPTDSDIGTTVGDPFYFEWEPTPLASMYQVELATDGNFNTVIGTCYTRNTTLIPSAATNTPGNSRSCMPASDGTYWWRVTAMDQYDATQWQVLVHPRTSQNTFIDAKFTYTPTRVTKQSPAPGSSVTIPTLQWAPLASAAKYHVKIWSTATGAEVAGTTAGNPTAATSYTPTTRLNPGTYRWDVIPVSEDGLSGTWLLPLSQPVFTLEAPDPPTAATPDLISPLTGTFSRSPLLSWDPVANASHYTVRVRPKGGTAWFTVGNFAYPQGTDASTSFLSPGTYQWHVEAMQTASSLGMSGVGEYTIADPSVVTGQVNALTLAGLNAGDICNGLECTDLRQTPVLSWDPSPSVGYYRVWIARNDNLSNMVPPSELGMSTNPFSVNATAWTPTTMLAESTAGSAYYWAVQPCYTSGKCAPNPVPLNSFNKASNPVDALSPGVVTVDGQPSGTVPEVSDDVTMTWLDYLETNDVAGQGSSELSTKATQPAREYQVQVSTDTTFSASTILDDKLVDQHSFTSFDTTYPEGNIYWRVRAIDSNANPLPWSSVMAFKKVSPVPTPAALQGLQPSTPTLSWEPVHFAATYQLEIFPKGSNVPRLTVTSKQVKWAPRLASQALPKGEYEWRVRRADAQGRFGGFSARSAFEVATTPVTLDSPIAGTQVAPRDVVQTWQAAEQATDYRVTWTSPQGAISTATTKATAWAPPSKLAAGAWTWTVDTRDANGNVTSTSAPGSFVVRSDLAATAATRIEGSGQLDTVLTGFAPEWSQQPDSVVYQWLRGSTPVGDGSLSYTVTREDVGQNITLRATATRLGYPNATSTSNAIRGVQGAAPIALTPPTITGSALVGETLTGNPPTWQAADVTMTYRWLVNGASVATAPTFVVRATDLGKQITFEVTGKRTNYANAVVTSAPVTAQAGGALQATTQPSISGTVASGSTVRVEPGTWSQPAPTFRYQWLRAGAPIPGAGGASYAIKPEDAGKDLSVTVLASKVGFNDGASTAPSVAVPKLKSATTSTLSKTRIKKGKTVKVGVSVAVPGVATPAGTIRIQDGVKTLKTFVMDPFRKGVMTVKLSTKKLKPGRHKIKLVYLGNASTSPSKAKTIRLIVFR
jgi:hypothetical protein